MSNKNALSTCLLLGAIGFALPITSNADSIFLCRVYSGGSIWSSARCDATKAVVEREIYVPDGMAWEQRVKYGEQRLAESRELQQAATQAPYSGPATTITTTTQSSVGTCQALAAEIANYDAMARQPQSGQTQDWIAEQKRKARSKQFSLHCQ